MNSTGVVQLVSMLGFIPVFFQGGSGGDHFAEIIQDQARPNLLLDVIELFRMKTRQANCILQFSERGFNSPTHMIRYAIHADLGRIMTWQKAGIATSHGDRREGPGMKNEVKSGFEVGLAVLFNSEARTIFEF